MLTKDLATAYSSRVCEYCNCYTSSIVPIEVFYARGRKKRWVTSCHNCAGEPEFSCDGRRLVTVDEQGAVYNSIAQAIKDAGRPIALVDAIKIAASKDPRVRDYCDVDNTLSEEDKCLWRLIYEIVSQGPNSRRIKPIQIQPTLIVEIY
ncbi:MAG: hypothetical protein HRF40_07935 [Nitrososphaera sp.]